MEVENELYKDYKSKLKKIIYKHLKLKDDFDEDDVSQYNIGTWTSFRHLSIIMEIEKEIKIKFDIDAITNMRTFKCFSEYLAENINQLPMS